MSKLLDHSVTSAMLEDLPTGIMLMENQKIRWVNRALADIFHTTKADLTGLNPKLAEGTGFSSIFEPGDRLMATDRQGKSIWFKRQIFNLGFGEFQVQLFTDISVQIELEMELERLQNELRTLETKDAVTGLLNRNAILQVLNSQVSRSRRYENPLALLRLSLSFSQPIADMREIVRDISQTLKDQLRWADQIGMLDDKTFLIILPETSFSAAKELATKLANDRTTLGDHHEAWSVRFGAAAWQKGDDPGKLLNRLQVDQVLNPIALLS